MAIPDPTPIFRFIHLDNLSVCLQRNGLFAPNFAPDDGLNYKTIHNEEIQQARHIRKIPCGPRGSIHDYVPFYFGYLSPMLFQLKTGRVAGYTEGQEPLIYLVSKVQAVQKHANFGISGTSYLIRSHPGTLFMCFDRLSTNGKKLIIPT